MTDSELVARLESGSANKGLSIGAAWNLMGEAAERIEALAAEVQRRDELAAGHPGMCCGVCARKIAAAEAEVQAGNEARQETRKQVMHLARGHGVTDAAMENRKTDDIAWLAVVAAIANEARRMAPVVEAAKIYREWFRGQQGLRNTYDVEHGISDAVDALAEQAPTQEEAP